jgi:hypothetical protein
MATAHWHFAEAERFAEAARLLFSYTSDSSDTAFDQETFEAMTAARTLAVIGQLHATLAHAAALGANERPGVPSPRSLDPRRSEKNGTRRRTDRKSSAGCDRRGLPEMNPREDSPDMTIVTPGPRISQREASDRLALIADLRLMADWLEANPTARVGTGASAHIQFSACLQAPLDKARNEVDRIAAAIGRTAYERGNQHVVEYQIGRVCYYAVAIDDAAEEDAAVQA